MAGNERQIMITIGADGSLALAEVDKTADGISNASKKMANDSKDAISSMKTSWLEFTAAAYAAYQTVSHGFEYMALGAKAEQAEESFHAVAEGFHEDANRIASDMKRVSAGIVDDSDLMQRSVQGLILGLKGNELVNLLEASRLAARVLGQDVVSTFDAVVYGVGSGVRAMGPLVQMGLLTKEQFELLNKATEAGIKDIDLYSLVMANATVQQAAFGGATMNNAERMQVFHAQVNQMKELIGTGLFGALGRVAAGWEIIGATAASAIMKMKTWGSGLFDSAEETQKKLAQINRDYAAEVAAIQKKWGIGDASVPGVPSQTDVDDAKRRLKEIEEALRNAVGSEETTKKRDQAIIDSWELEDRINKAREAAIIADWELEDRINKGRDAEIIADWELEDRINKAREAEIIADWELEQRIADERKRDQEEYIARYREFMDLKQREHEMEMTRYDQLMFTMQQMAGQLGGDLGQGFGMMASGLQGMTDIAMGRDPYSAELEKYQEFLRQKLLLYQQMTDEEIRIHFGYLTQKDAVIAAWNEYEVQQEWIKQQQKLQMMSSAFQGMAGVMYAFYAASDKQNKTAFRAYQAFSIAQAMIDAYKSITIALATIPPPYSYVVAAVNFAMAVAQVSRIASMKPGGAATGGGFSGGGGGFQYSPPLSMKERQDKKGRASQVINVHVYGNIVDHDAFARELIPAITKAQGDNVK